nr:3294_t:CDS:2 [Entrophospora candida]
MSRIIQQILCKKQQQFFSENNSNQCFDEFLKQQHFSKSLAFSEISKNATPNRNSSSLFTCSFSDAEHFWFIMASIHTSKRNCLTNTHASKIAKIKWHSFTTKSSNNLSQTPIPSN